ncbi:MAG: Gfo/Idh/MocA family oxidoreductase, partial [Acidobacteriota bacterium]|nr:Gfo/Idh/MocA family oxidoreductase [Acidobacteriota bacterium]
MSDTNVPRRTFLRAAGAMTALSYSRVYGANERVQLGLIGAGDRGRHDTENFVKTGQADVVAVCDIWGNSIDQAKSKWPAAASYEDHRKLLENKTVDVAVIATPDHWHSVIA